MYARLTVPHKKSGPNALLAQIDCSMLVGYIPGRHQLPVSNCKRTFQYLRAYPTPSDVSPRSPERRTDHLRDSHPHRAHRRDGAGLNERGKAEEVAKLGDNADEGSGTASEQRRPRGDGSPEAYGDVAPPREQLETVCRALRRLVAHGSSSMSISDMFEGESNWTACARRGREVSARLPARKECRGTALGMPSNTPRAAAIHCTREMQSTCE